MNEQKPVVPALFQLLNQIKYLVNSPPCVGRRLNMTFSEAEIKLILQHIEHLTTQNSRLDGLIIAYRNENKKLENKLNRQTKKRRKTCRKRKY